MKKMQNLEDYVKSDDLSEVKLYSKEVIKSLVHSILRPIIKENAKAVIFLRLKELEETESLLKRLEYSDNIVLKEFTDYEYSKFDVADINFIILTTQRYNCAFIYQEVKKDNFKIYFKINSADVLSVYESLKTTFKIDYDKEFYEYKVDRRDNVLMNEVFKIIIDNFQDSIKETEYSVKIQQNYKTVSETASNLNSEIVRHVKQIAHEIKNQLSILDIYTRIYEKNTDKKDNVAPIRKSIEIIKKQIEQFKNSDVVNLQECDIKNVIQEAIRNYSVILKDKNNKLVFIDEMAGYETNAFIDEDKLLIILGNVIQNANDSTENDDITIKLKEVEEKIKILVINHGKKIESEEKERIFQDGYTTKEHGWGVGLAVCRKYIDSQFGTLSLEKSDETETIFSITLPLTQII